MKEYIGTYRFLNSGDVYEVFEGEDGRGPKKKKVLKMRKTQSTQPLTNEEIIVTPKYLQRMLDFKSAERVEPE